MLEQYGDIRLLNIQAAAPEVWNMTGADAVRIELPTNAASELEMYQKGFYLADRTIGVSISLAKLPENLDRYVRLPIVETDAYKEDILRIATQAFVYDRRFHILPVCNPAIAEKVLKKWVEELDKTLICLYKESPIGFLALKETAPDTLFVHLAAVEEKYRLTGAAMALYAKACLVARERGYKKLEGRISSQNMAVLNVYNVLGGGKAVFGSPKDVFLKEVTYDT